MYQYKESNIISEPIELEEAKSFMRVSHTSDDAQIINIIKRVRQRAEQILSRSFAQKTITYYEAVAERDIIALPFPQHSSISSVLIDGIESIDSIKQKGLTQSVIEGSFTGKEITVLYLTTGETEEGVKSAMLKEILNQYQNKDSYYMQNMADVSDRFIGMLQPYVNMSF